MTSTSSSSSDQIHQKIFYSTMKQNKNPCMISLKKRLKEYHSSRAVPTVSLLVGNIEVGDEPAQLHRIIDVMEACLRHVQEEKE
jgi:hypothetical protein